jgi:hypothetical protein
MPEAEKFHTRKMRAWAGQKNTHFRLSVEQQDVEIVSTQIEESYQGIQSHDFFEGCREKDCHWCNFHYSKVVKE